MAYELNMILKLANPAPTDNFTEATRQWFINAAAIYEENSAKSAVNRKSIIVNPEDISREEIKIKLISEVDLSVAPGRALSHLSRILIDDTIPGFDSFYKDNLYFKRLFLTTVITEEVREITDVELVKVLIDYITTPKSGLSEKKRNAIRSVKNIMRNAGFFDEI